MYGRIRELALLAGRIGVGTVFLAHGLQKWDMGLSGVTGMVAGMGIPLPSLTAVFLLVIETVGAVAFMVGFALPVVALGFAVDTIGALFYVHIDNGLIGNGGYELVLALAAAAIGLGLAGGKLSLDYLLFVRRRTRQGALASA